jgi:hypothetical protein
VQTLKRPIFYLFHTDLMALVKRFRARLFWFWFYLVCWTLLKWYERVSERDYKSVSMVGLHNRQRYVERKRDKGGKDVTIGIGMRRERVRECESERVRE